MCYIFLFLPLIYHSMNEMGSIISDKRLKVALHVLIWVIIFFFPQYIFKVFGFGDIRFLSHFYVNTIVYGILFYINYLWFVPKFYFRDKKVVYLLAIFLYIVVLYFIVVYINDQILFNPDKDKLLGEVKRKKCNTDVHA